MINRHNQQTQANKPVCKFFHFTFLAKHMT